MANTRFGYVRQYELPDPLLPATFLVVRLDGKGFHGFSDRHGFSKPNDRRALDLMNAAAMRTICSETLRQHVVLAFGESDEFSFLISSKSNLFSRRSSKISSTFVSIFTASYCILWPQFFPDTPLDTQGEGPSFDARVVVYPGKQQVIDYFKWRQADTHINNLYNTAFWALIQQGQLSVREAHATLNGTVSAQKHEILFSRYGINYNELDPMYRRGSILLWDDQSTAATQVDGDDKATAAKSKRSLLLLHEDMLKDQWWTSTRPTILDSAS